MRSVALSTEQPCGMVGRLNRTRARRLPPLLDMTLRIESEPLFDEVLPESIQASAAAGGVLRPDGEGVWPGRQARVRLRRGAGRVRARVELALEGEAGRRRLVVRA